MKVYEKCPVLENDRFKLRLIEMEDADALLKVYSDKNALPFFNSDNCNGTNFYNTTREGMQEAIKCWLWEYSNKVYVRFSIIDKRSDVVIGTIEIFNRMAEDYYNNTGLLRVDVRSDYENAESLYGIFDAIVGAAYELFDCEKIATKAPVYAIERIDALKKMQFEKCEEPLKGKNRVYYDYWVRNY